jgi:uncharacterized protein (TIGR02679 family)
LGGPDTAWLLDRVRGRLERGEGAEGTPLTGRAVMRHPTHGQRVAVARLLGPQPSRGEALSVDLATLDRVIRSNLWPAGLPDAVVRLTGPVSVRREVAARREAAWAAASAASAPARAVHPSLREWFGGWVGEGNLKRTARSESRRLGRKGAEPEELALIAGDFLAAAARVMEALPAGGELRSVFAQRVLGDAHGMDRGRAVATVSGAAVVALTECEDARRAWELVGVPGSTLASTVLALGVPGNREPFSDEMGTVPISAGPARATATALEAARSVPMAMVLTLDQVSGGAVAPLGPEGTVFVCENPSILESAASALMASERGSDRAGSARACLICVSGQPSVAATDLIARVSSAGAEVRYHGDFDWAGLRIAGTLARSVDWRPWRFGARDYRDATRRASGAASPVSLAGKPAESPWDPALAEAMSAVGVVAEEEGVVDLLVEDILAAW